MKKTGILIFILLALTLLPLLVSCKKTPEKTDEIRDLTIFENGASTFKIVVTENHGESYERALSILQDAFESSFGTRLETIVHPSAVQKEKDLPKYDDFGVIFLGDINGNYPAITKAKETLHDSGYAAFPVKNTLALYSKSEELLCDLCELFASKYIKNNNGSLVITEDFSLSRPFTSLVSPDGKGHDYALPVISINTENNLPINSTIQYLNASVSVSNVYSEFAMENASARVRGRGNGTWNTKNSSKKPYKLKFDNKVNLLGIGGGNSREWVLFSNPLDFSELRNRIAFTLGQKVFDNLSYVSNSEYAVLYVNGKYRGVYLVCEQVEAASHKIDIRENKTDPYSSEYLLELDQYATNASNGYTIYVDYFECYGRYWVIKSDYNSRERCMYVYYLMNDMMKAIESGNKEEILKYIDMDSCVDMYLLHEFMKNTDVGWSSFYLVLRSDKKFEFTCPWDFDLSSGNDYRIHDGSYSGLYVGDSINVVRQSNPIFYMLMKCDFFKSLVAERWDEVSDSILDVALSEIKNITGKYSAEFYEDIKANYKYKEDPDQKNHFVSDDPAASYDGNVEHLIDWLQNRHRWLDRYLGHMMKA